MMENAACRRNACGVLGLAARFLLTANGRWAYVFAYLAGGFYPAMEVWERPSETHH